MPSVRSAIFTRSVKAIFDKSIGLNHVTFLLGNDTWGGGDGGHLGGLIH